MRQKDSPTFASRRAVLLMLGGTFVAESARSQPLPFPAARQRCVVTPEQTEGPYFVDRRLKRSDLRTDADGSVTPGLPLLLRLNIAAIAGAACAPVAGAMVDIWHCNAAGVYSAVGPAHAGADQPFLRGYQITNADGSVLFSSIYPGWYPGRAVHIHFKVRARSASGRNHEFTSQLYFDDAVTDRVHALAPYANRKGRRPKNEEDGLFRSGGRELMLSTQPVDDGYAAWFDVALRMT